MELNNIINKLNKQHKGTFVHVGWKSNIESAKARKQGVEVVKETNAVVRWGIRYDNLKRVKALKAEKMLSGEQHKAVTPWYKHMENNSYIIQHLSKPATYLQLYTVNNKKNIKSKYYINGVEATKQQVIDSGYVNASEWSPKQECLIMNIPTENILYIGKEK